MEFSHDLPKSKLQINLEQLDVIYEEMQAHPGEWTRVRFNNYEPIFVYDYSGYYLTRAYLKRYPHLEFRCVDRVHYVRYMVPERKRSTRRLFARINTEVAILVVIILVVATITTIAILLTPAR